MLLRGSTTVDEADIPPVKARLFWTLACLCSKPKLTAKASGKTTRERCGTGSVRSTQKQERKDWPSVTNFASDVTSSQPHVDFGRSGFDEKSYTLVRWPLVCVDHQPSARGKSYQTTCWTAQSTRCRQHAGEQKSSADSCSI